MKPVLIQNLIKYYQNRKPAELAKTDFDHVHGGHKDRSGFIVFLLLVVFQKKNLLMREFVNQHFHYLKLD